MGGPAVVNSILAIAFGDRTEVEKNAAGPDVNAADGVAHVVAADYLRGIVVAVAEVQAPTTRTDRMHIGKDEAVGSVQFDIFLPKTADVKGFER